MKSVVPMQWHVGRHVSCKNAALLREGVLELKHGCLCVIAECAGNRVCDICMSVSAAAGDAATYATQSWVQSTAARALGL